MRRPTSSSRPCHLQTFSHAYIKGQENTILQKEGMGRALGLANMWHIRLGFMMDDLGFFAKMLNFCKQETLQLCSYCTKIFRFYFQQCCAHLLLYKHIQSSIIINCISSNLPKNQFQLSFLSFLPFFASLPLRELQLIILFHFQFPTSALIDSEQTKERAKSLVDHFLERGIDDLLDLADEVLRNLVLLVGPLHVAPHSVELLLGDGHVLVRVVHGPALVVVGPAEHHAEEVSDQAVQHGYLAHVLEVKDVQLVVVEDGLVEVSHNQLDVPPSAQLLVKSRHPSYCQNYKIKSSSLPVQLGDFEWLHLHAQADVQRHNFDHSQVLAFNHYCCLDVLDRASADEDVLAAAEVHLEALL